MLRSAARGDDVLIPRSRIWTREQRALASQPSNDSIEEIKKILWRPIYEDSKDTRPELLLNTSGDSIETYPEPPEKRIIDTRQN